MTVNFVTVKLNRRLVDEARREAELFQRSLAGQIEHWARLGRAIENAKGFSIDRVRATLAGELKLEELSDAEQDAFFAELQAEFDAPSPSLQASYAKLGQERRAARARRLQGESAPRGSKSAA